MIKKISAEETSKIIITREPRGLFYHQTQSSYIGIDNRKGDAWVEDFKTLTACKRWLLDLTSAPYPPYPKAIRLTFS